MKKKLDIDDALILLGGALVAGGIWLIYFPAALIIVGLAFLLLGIRGGRFGGKKQ